MKKTMILSGVSAFALLVAVILALVSNGIGGYAMEHIGLSVTGLVVALLAFAADCYLSKKLSNHNPVIVAVGVIALIFLVVALTNLILDSAVLAAAQFTYDYVNPVGWQALITRGISVVCVVAGMALLGVKSFLND